MFHKKPHNVRASYGDETKEQIEGLWTTLHYRKIGVICPDDASGGAVLLGVQTALQARGSQPIAAASYVRQTNQFHAAIEKVKAANPDAVVAVGPSNTVAPMIKQVHAKGWKPLFVTVSFVGTEELIQDAGPPRHGDHAGRSSLLLDGLEDRGALPADAAEIHARREA